VPNVVLVENNLFTCSTDTQTLISTKIKENDLNRVVVAACTPRTHEPLFQDTLKEAGLNGHLVEMANIRNHNAWVHQKQPEMATAKAKDQVRMAVARASAAYSLDALGGCGAKGPGGRWRHRRHESGLDAGRPGLSHGADRKKRLPGRGGRDLRTTRPRAKKSGRCWRT
jgi:hypothetical protein